MDVSEVRFSREHLQRAIQVIAGVVLLVVLWLAAKDSWFTIEARKGEQAVIQRFGRYHTTVSESGLHLKLPFGIDQVTHERVLEVKRVEIGFSATNLPQTDRPGGGPGFRDEPRHSIAITRDQNLVDAEYVVQYEISNLKKYLFVSAYPDWTVKQAIKAVMRDVIANRDIDYILTTGRAEMQQAAVEQLQQTVDAYDIGIRIQAVQFQDVHAPGPVIPAFDDVQKAKEEKETAINEGKRYRNQVVPKAEGQAKQVVTEAEAYRIRRINEARGDAERFKALYERYLAEPELTRRQLYLQALQEILPGMEKIIIDGEPGSFLLPLERGGKK